MKYVRYLSYPIEKNIPVYGAWENDINCVQVKSIIRGDACNTSRFTLDSHWGTHIDFPAHFFEVGQTVMDYSPDYWLFKHPQVLSMDVKPGHIIKKEDFNEAIKPDTDILLLYTGWVRYRGQAMYSINNPGLSPELGLWLRTTHPCLRAIGVDFVSISSYTDRDLGRQAHRAFLDPGAVGEPILPVEDMMLSGNLDNLSAVWVAPWLIEGLDGSPCTVMGFFK